MDDAGVKSFLEDFRIAQRIEALAAQGKTETPKSKPSLETTASSKLETSFGLTMTPPAKGTPMVKESTPNTSTYNVGSQRSRKARSTKEDIVFLFRQKCKSPYSLGS